MWWRPTSWRCGARARSGRGSCGPSCAGRATRPSRSRCAVASSRSTSASPRRCCSTRRGGSGAMAGADALPLRRVEPAPRRRLGAVEELIDALASFVALRGARGVLVFDGEAGTRRSGPSRCASPPTRTRLLERLAAEHRGGETVAVISSDFDDPRHGQPDVRSTSSRIFLAELRGAARPQEPRPELADRLDPGIRERVEQTPPRRVAAVGPGASREPCGEHTFDHPRAQRTMVPPGTATFPSTSG